MSNYNNYLDMLMTNYPLNSDGSESEGESYVMKKMKQSSSIINFKNNRNQKGGKSKSSSKKLQRQINLDRQVYLDRNTLNDNGSINEIVIGEGEDVGDVPFGGFPPIFISTCKPNVNVLDNDKKEREYSKHKTAVSIKDIMKKRRDSTPLITM